MSGKAVVKYDEMGVIDGSTMGLPREMSEEIWKQEVFPEWGTYLNYEIDQFQVEPGTGVLWYFGGTSFALKSQAGAVFTVDLWAGPSMFTDYSYCGVCQTAGADRLHWMRTIPCVINPWRFKRLDAMFITHHHQDHMCFYSISAGLQTTNCKFVAPPETIRRIRRMGVPDERLVVASVGDSVQFKDMKVDVVPNYDPVAAITGFTEPAPLEEVAASYIFNTQGGGIIFVGDSAFWNGYRMLGEKYSVDVVVTNMGHSAPGITDKMTPFDSWRLAANLNAKVLLPMHYDNWGCAYMDPSILEAIIQDQKRVGRSPDIKTVVLLPGARYVHPQDMNIGRYNYPDWRERFHWEKSLQYGPRAG